MRGSRSALGKVPAISLGMSAVRGSTHGGSAADVTFEVERVEWPSPDRLEVVGRWFGVRGRRFIRPTLDAEVNGEPRRMLAVLDHKPWAVEDGKAWVAAFRWDGEPADLAGSELTVGPDISVELLRAGEKKKRPEKQVARRPRADVLESELAAARERAQRFSRELHAARAEHTAEMVRTAAEQEAEIARIRSEAATTSQEAEHRTAELRGELDAARDKLGRLETAVQKARDELAVARADATEVRDGLEGERATIAAQAAKSAAEEAERLRAERDEARRESATARGERDAAIRDRDQARRESNTWRSNIRTEGEKRQTVPLTPAAARPNVPVPQEWSEPAERTPQVPARIVAVAALVVLVLVLVLLVAWAL